MSSISRDLRCFACSGPADRKIGWLYVCVHCGTIFRRGTGGVRRTDKIRPERGSQILHEGIHAPLPGEEKGTVREVRPISGVTIDASDDDRALIALMEIPWISGASTLDGARVIGPDGAVKIKLALRAAGFEIVRNDRRARLVALARGVHGLGGVT